MSGVVAIRTLPAIWVHRCSVSQAWLHASSGKSGQSEVPTITKRLAYRSVRQNSVMTSAADDPTAAVRDEPSVRDCARKQGRRRDRLKMFHDLMPKLALEAELCQFTGQLHPLAAFNLARIFGGQDGFGSWLRLGDGDDAVCLTGVLPRLGFKVNDPLIQQLDLFFGSRERLIAALVVIQKLVRLGHQRLARFLSLAKPHLSRGELVLQFLALSVPVAGAFICCRQVTRKFFGLCDTDNEAFAGICQKRLGRSRASGHSCEIVL